MIDQKIKEKEKPVHYEITPKELREFATWLWSTIDEEHKVQNNCSSIEEKNKVQNKKQNRVLIIFKKIINAIKKFLIKG